MHPKRIPYVLSVRNLQTSKMPSLPHLQSMREWNGPSLPMDEQLHWFWEFEAFHIVLVLRMGSISVCTDFIRIELLSVQ